MEQTYLCPKEAIILSAYVLLGLGDITLFTFPCRKVGENWTIQLSCAIFAPDVKAFESAFLNKVGEHSHWIPPVWKKTANFHGSASCRRRSKRSLMTAPRPWQPINLSGERGKLSTAIQFDSLVCPLSPKQKQMHQGLLANSASNWHAGHRLWLAREEQHANWK